MLRKMQKNYKMSQKNLVTQKAEINSLKLHSDITSSRTKKDNKKPYRYIRMNLQ
jgi:hypothetical protein